MLAVFAQVAAMVERNRDRIAVNSKAIEEFKRLHTEMAGTIQGHGLAVARNCFTMAPLAHAKGDSLFELLDVKGRWDQGRVSYGIYEINPNNEFAVDVRGTGSLRPSDLLRVA